MNAVITCVGIYAVISLIAIYTSLILGKISDVVEVAEQELKDQIVVNYKIYKYEEI